MFTTWASPDADSVAAVRRGLARNLQLLGVDPELIDDAELILGELLVNSIRHARPLASGRIEVTWELLDQSLRLRVTDGGGTQSPHVKDATAVEAGGRGLRIVEALSDRWGVTPDGDTSTVWAEVGLRRTPASVNR